MTKDEESNTPIKHSGRPTVTDIDYSDPATWTSHDDPLRQQLVQHGPMQILDIRFPKDKNQRKFSSFHYQRHLPNGEAMHRKWLQYSVSTDSEKKSNELIDILANAIKEEILRNARAAKYFSIILDSTPDVSHVEQMTVIIRFVQVDEDNAVIAVREHFLGYVPLQETTGAFMAETILKEFKKWIYALTTCEVKVMIMAAI
ncbi:52 kDa repressor of the inhibitor of the protein kinase-like [Palaemon carinicauda]|uniref:52 kDa repressor of the inhibitor of the protein kinase-like n=1 Tax=Palaemon carinicauda TaxID=392227 RepID=UPI0035B67B3A